MPNTKESLKIPLLTAKKELAPYERSDFKWIIIGSSLMSLCAGFVDIVSLLSTFAFMVSHNTGTTSAFAICLGRHDISTAGFYSKLILAFLIGSMLVGALIKREKFHYSKAYGFLLILESFLLVLIVYFHSEHDRKGVLIASFSMGLQNALFTNFSGAVVRTTHVTGLLTDIGIQIGHLIRWREKAQDFWLLHVLLPIYVGFITGGVLGTVCFELFDVKAFYIPSLMLCLSGMFWTILRLFWKKHKRH